MDEAAYVASKVGSIEPLGVRQWIRLTLVACLAGAMLFSWWSAWLGMTILAGVAVAVNERRFAKWSARRQYLFFEHIHGELEYEVTHESLRFRSARLEARSSWTNLQRFGSDDEHLYLECLSMPPLVLPIVELERAGVAAIVKELARTACEARDASVREFARRAYR